MDHVLVFDHITAKFTCCVGVQIVGPLALCCCVAAIEHSMNPSFPKPRVTTTKFIVQNETDALCSKCWGLPGLQCRRAIPANIPNGNCQFCYGQDPAPTVCVARPLHPKPYTKSLRFYAIHPIFSKIFDQTLPCETFQPQTYLATSTPEPVPEPCKSWWGRFFLLKNAQGNMRPSVI